MPRAESSVAPGWWDYTTLDQKLVADAAALTGEQVFGLSRPGFRVVVYDTLEEFYLAEALEYIHAWKQATADNPVGICGPIGPTAQGFLQTILSFFRRRPASTAPTSIEMPAKGTDISKL